MPFAHMSSTNKEWLVILLYFVLLIIEGACEAAWLHRKAWASWAKALLFSWLTNLIAWCIGFFVLFVTVGVTLALAWDGSMQRLPFKGNEAGVALVLALLFLPALLTLIKRAFLALLQMQRGRKAWQFALISSLSFWLLPLLLTVVLTKFFWRFL